MGCSCNKSANRSSRVTKRQVTRPRVTGTRGARSNEQGARVVRRMLDRY